MSATASPLLLDRIPILATVGVLVAGAGTAGRCAALVARETGAASVPRLERSGFRGGTSTQMLDTFNGFFMPLAADGGARAHPRSLLQTRLRPRGALLETPPDIAATGRDAWHRNNIRQRHAS